MWKDKTCGGREEAWNHTQFKPSNRIKFGNSLKKKKYVYDSMVSYGWVSSQNYLAALYTAASGFTGSGSFSEGSPCHAISLLSFPWITAHYNTTIGLVQISVQCNSVQAFLTQNYSPLYFSGTILLEKLYLEESWFKHCILNIESSTEY